MFSVKRLNRIRAGEAFVEVNLAVYGFTAACLVGRPAWPFGIGEEYRRRILNIYSFIWILMPILIFTGKDDILLAPSLLLPFL